MRRLKEDLRAIAGGFPKRNVKQIDIDGLPPETPELRLSELLDQYRELRERRLQGESRRKQAAAALLISGLQQRLLSSIEAFARTLRVHRRTVLRHWEAAQAGEPGPEASPVAPDLFAHGIDPDDDRATLGEDELQAEEEAQIEAATLATAGPTRRPLREGAVRAGAGAAGRDDGDRRGRPRAPRRPRAEARRLGPRAHVPGTPRGRFAQPGGPPARWNETRVLIFTEYDDTKRYLQRQLEAAIASTDRASERIRIYHGPTPQAEREEIKRAFNADPKRHPVRILIATDAAREGLNLQTHCWNLFHFDVPWNPSRMEQRNGRIDRKLQPKDEVFCHYFVYKQRLEDRILRVLVRKTETIKLELGSLSQVVESRLASTLKYGIRRRDIDAMEQELRTADLDATMKATVRDDLEGTTDDDDRRARRAPPPGRGGGPAPPGGAEGPDRPAPESAREVGEVDRPGRGPLPLGHLLRPAARRRRHAQAGPGLGGLGPARLAVRVPRARPAPGGRPDVGRHDGHAPGPEAAGPEALGVAEAVADPAGGLRGHRPDGRGRRPPPPRAPGRAAAPRPVHRAGVRPPRPLAGLRRPDEGRHPPRRADRAGSASTARGRRGSTRSSSR